MADRPEKAPRVLNHAQVPAHHGHEGGVVGKRGIGQHGDLGIGFQEHPGGLL